VTRLAAAMVLAFSFGCGDGAAVPGQGDAGASDGGTDAGAPDLCCACAVETGGLPSLSGFACVAWLREADPASPCLSEVCADLTE